MNKIYSATATAQCDRNGRVQSPDKLVDFDFRFPKAMGGANDNYLNPELLFCSGLFRLFSQCAEPCHQPGKSKDRRSHRSAQVSLGKLDESQYSLAVNLEITIPGVDHEKAEELAYKADAVCPYSNATRGNIEANLIVKETDLAIAYIFL